MIVFVLAAAMLVPAITQKAIEDGVGPEEAQAVRVTATIWYLCGMVIPLAAAYFTHNRRRWQ